MSSSTRTTVLLLGITAVVAGAVGYFLASSFFMRRPRTVVLRPPTLPLSVPIDDLVRWHDDYGYMFAGNGKSVFDLDESGKPTACHLPKDLLAPKDRVAVRNEQDSKTDLDAEDTVKLKISDNPETIAVITFPGKGSAVTWKFHQDGKPAPCVPTGPDPEDPHRLPDELMNLTWDQIDYESGTWKKVELVED